eukprot:Anaeramoba_flamelloidesa1124307_5.p3 GENE.a1124307_5~~a1124307_5.p3  ORF type:complete len:115 (+),score=51.96 a1124307_5:52-396(+)
MSEFNNRVALITGGATLIGAAVAEAFVSNGARVAILDIDAEAGAQLADRLGSAALFIEKAKEGKTEKKKKNSERSSEKKNERGREKENKSEIEREKEKKKRKGKRKSRENAKKK